MLAVAVVEQEVMELLAQHLAVAVLVQQIQLELLELPILAVEAVAVEIFPQRDMTGAMEALAL
jgi:hypothetical protein